MNVFICVSNIKNFMHNKLFWFYIIWTLLIFQKKLVEYRKLSDMRNTQQILRTNEEQKFINQEIMKYLDHTSVYRILKYRIQKIETTIQKIKDRKQSVKPQKIQKL